MLEYEDNKQKEDVIYQNIIKKFLPHYQANIKEAINNNQVYICALPSISPNRIDKNGKPERYYHLGHLFFAHLFDEIIDIHANTTLLICPAHNYFYKIPNFNEMVVSVGNDWLKCFGFQIYRYEIYPFIYSQQLDDKFLKLIAWLDEKEREFRKLGRKFLKEIEDWRDNFPLENKTKSKIKMILNLGNENFTDDQVFSLAYILIKRPNWYSPDWFAKSIKSLVNGNESIQNRLFGTNKILIIEAYKNRTSWEPLAICSVHFELGTFPKRAYFLSLPSIKGEKPMSSKYKNEAIFLSENPNKVINRYKENNLLDIIRMFELSNSSNDLENSLKKLMKEGVNRLK